MIEKIKAEIRRDIKVIKQLGNKVAIPKLESKSLLAYHKFAWKLDKIRRDIESRPVKVKKVKITKKKSSSYPNRIEITLQNSEETKQFNKVLLAEQFLHLTNPEFRKCRKAGFYKDWKITEICKSKICDLYTKKGEYIMTATPVILSDFLGCAAVTINNAVRLNSIVLKKYRLTLKGKPLNDIKKVVVSKNLNNGTKIILQKGKQKKLFNSTIEAMNFLGISRHIFKISKEKGYYNNWQIKEGAKRTCSVFTKDGKLIMTGITSIIAKHLGYTINYINYSAKNNTIIDDKYFIIENGKKLLKVKNEEN